MKKTFIAAALFALVGAAQAYDAQGETTSSAIITTGGATVIYHGPIGAPGVALGDSNYISLASIDNYSYKDSATTSGGVAFRKYQLLGYPHAGAGGNIATDLNWFKVPAVATDVYFGLATNSGTPTQHAAFYVGDRTGYAVPTSTTNYAAVALLAVGSTTGTTPEVLTGSLQYDTVSAKLVTTGVNGLSNGNGYKLTLDTNVNAAAGTFSGNSALAGTAVGAGTASGKFYGSGATSAVAGIATGTTGAAYVASFGGIKN